MIDGLALLGAGGFAREMYWHVQETWPGTPIVFVDDVTDTLKVTVGGRDYPVVKDWNFHGISGIPGVDRPLTIRHFAIAIGDPKAKRILAAKAIDAALEPAPTVIHPRALVQGNDCVIGRGGVIAPGCVITTNVTIGDYVLLNLNCTVGHDAVLASFVTCNPGCHVSGNVTLGEGVSLGTGTAVREKTAIAAGVVTGAQACVAKGIETENIVVAGVPAKPLGG